MFTGIPILLFLGLVQAQARAPAGPWDTFNYAPASKTVFPIGIYNVSENVLNVENLIGTGNGETTLVGNGSWVALDFGVEVGGLITLTISPSSSSSHLTLAYSESPLFVGSLASDDSSYPAENMTYDGVLTIPSPLAAGKWSQPADTLRGGFRYLTIAAYGDQVSIAEVSCAISFAPHVEDLRAYTGYFYAKDPEPVYEDEDFLTKIWYAGAYTVQTNTVPLNTGRKVPFASAGHWYNNASLGVAGPIIVDGAKRDRAVWPGDMGIAVPAQFVSTLDLIPTRNALSTMFAAIESNGALPESGPPLSQKGSDTYHAWTLIGTHNYYLYSGDTEWLETIWTNYTRAVAFLEAKVDSSGLMNVTGLRDWARLGGGGHNAEGNALLYQVLLTASQLASALSLTDLSGAWSTNATALKAVFNDAFWVESTGMYRDNITTTMSPQDANSLAVLYNLTRHESYKARISAGLELNWNELGAVAPELPDTISPFIGGFELQAHFEAGEDARAMDLLRREWGYMLHTNLSVQSTLLEGFTANGSIRYRSYRGYNYDAAYTSHAHGWSTGPTPALTFYVLGLTVTDVQGAKWKLSPHVAGLEQAEGGFSTALGWFGVKWKLLAGVILNVAVQTPDGTQGVFKVPKGFEEGSLRVDGDSISGQGADVVLEGGNHVLVLHKS